MSQALVVADIGGTHARFALAAIAADGANTLGDPMVLRCADFAGLEDALAVFAEAQGAPLPPRLAIGFAGPVRGERLTLVNSHWVLEPATFAARLGMTEHLVLNDFAAIAHAVDVLGEQDLHPVAGPPGPLPRHGLISILGPGTGLGISSLLRGPAGATVIPTEGGHMHFAPTDAVEDAILLDLRARYGRVSIERLLSGPGLVAIFRVLEALAGRSAGVEDERALWTEALAGTDTGARAALDRFCAILGAVAGDVALTQGGSAVVLAGGLGLRLRDHLATSDFHARFCDKGRFRFVTEAMPIRLITHPQPGLLGAAAAFASARA